MKFYKYNLDYLAMTIEEKYWSPNFVAGYVPTDLFPVTWSNILEQDYVTIIKVAAVQIDKSILLRFE